MCVPPSPAMARCTRPTGGLAAWSPAHRGGSANPPPFCLHNHPSPHHCWPCRGVIAACLGTVIKCQPPPSLPDCCTCRGIVAAYPEMVASSLLERHVGRYLADDTLIIRWVPPETRKLMGTRHLGGAGSWGPAEPVRRPAAYTRRCPGAFGSAGASRSSGVPEFKAECVAVPQNSHFYCWVGCTAELPWRWCAAGVLCPMTQGRAGR